MDANEKNRLRTLCERGSINQVAQMARVTVPALLDVLDEVEAERVLAVETRAEIAAERDRYREVLQHIVNASGMDDLDNYYEFVDAHTREALAWSKS